MLKKALLVAPLQLGISGNNTTTRRLSNMLTGFFDVVVDIRTSNKTAQSGQLSRPTVGGSDMGLS